MQGQDIRFGESTESVYSPLTSNKDGQDVACYYYGRI